jgi:replication initiation and membrane attachment protein DnaB
MTEKHPLCPQRLRQVRERYIDQVSHQAAALYLFLVTVADSQGLSFYSDPSLMKRLSLDEPTLEEARRNLIRLGLIAYSKPLYQVLSLDANPLTQGTRKPMDQALSLGRIFREIMGGAS